MMDIGIICDCHNTLVLSNEAWIKSFTDFLGMDHYEEISRCLYGKIKRRELAHKYNLNFGDVEKKAESYVKENTKVIKLLNTLKLKGIDLFVVSNAPRRRVITDLRNTGIINMFKKIYSEEDGGKKNLQLFDKILSDHNLEFALFLGNEEFDDNIEHPNVLSVALTSFLIERFKNVGNLNFDSKGRIKDKL